MRKVMNALYDGAAALAALCLFGLLIMVLLSIGGRQFHFYVPGTDAYAGYLMAASGFLALAHTLKRGEHIRVTLVLATLSGRWKKALQSRNFNDISTGSDATPLWIPQIAMGVGAVILANAFIDELILELRGQRTVPTSEEPLRNE